MRILAGLTTGAVSVSVAQPTEVVKIRMQAAGAGTGPVYSGVIQAYREIATKEGFRGLWRGSNFLQYVVKSNSINRKL